jgi:hypothetical protein
MAMQRRHGLLVLLTIIIVMACAYSGLMSFLSSGLPISVNVVDARTAEIAPRRGIPLPPALHAGDRIHLAAQPLATRIVIAMNRVNTLPAGRTYDFVIPRRGADFAVPLTTVNPVSIQGAGWSKWAFSGFVVLLGGIALLALWRGHDRAAAGMVLWATAFLVGLAISLLPFDGLPGLTVQAGVALFYLLARIGFYVLVESMLVGTLTVRARVLWRGSLLLLLGAAATVTIAGPVVFVATGWAGLLLPQYGAALTAPYFVPLALLVASYRRAQPLQRLRLRWMLWSSVLFVVTVLFANTSLANIWLSASNIPFLLVLAMAGFLYAVLRHRVVDVTVVLNRALVYAATTSLVLGLFALLESVIERTTLGHDASRLLELAVPLGLGAALSTVHRRIEAFVERFLFRHQYRAETALRGFAQECAFVTEVEDLFALTVDQIAQNTGAPRVALYESTAQGYACVRQRGTPALPQAVAVNDLAFIKLRTRNAELDLSGTPGQLGADGYAFPLMVRGSLLGALVVGQRPGEHYVAEERELLFHVAHEVGAALFALRAREMQTFVRAVAQGALKPEEARKQAIQLETAWVMA